MSPIVGFRYHLPGHNWDVCQAEFDKLPDSEKALYTKIAPPCAPPKRFGAGRDEPADRNPSGVHPGVTCDKSGMSPIVGFRYHLPGHNWDVCQAEFDKLPDSEKALYTKIAPPSHASKDCGPPHHRFGGGFRGGGFGGGGPFGGFGRGGRGSGGEGPKLSARFVRDVSIFDGTQMAPGDKFTKIWRIKNVGQVPWPPGTKMLFVGGDQMSSELSVPVGAAPVMPGEEVDVAVDMIAPQELGRYVGYWRLTGPLGRRRFGQRVWAHVHVVDPQKADEPPNENEIKRMAEAHAEAKMKAVADDDDDDDDVDENGSTTAEDGYFGPDSTMALQSMLQSEGLATGPIDGHFGPRTKAAVQTFLTARSFDLGPIDGWWGRRSTRALQAWLREQGAAPGPIDGRWGPRTSRAFQAVLNELRKKPSSTEAPATAAAAAPSSEPVAAEPASSKDAASSPMPADKEGGSPFVKVERDEKRHDPETFGYNEKYGAWMPVGVDADKWAAENLALPCKAAKAPAVKAPAAASPEAHAPAEKSDMERVADELTVMGFTDAELVHCVIDKNGADLEACASDLASLSEWDTLLEDLDEMGFADRSLNKRLMVKNKGSLKMTVRDLVADRA